MNVNPGAGGVNLECGTPSGMDKSDSKTTPKGTRKERGLDGVGRQAI